MKISVAKACTFFMIGSLLAFSSCKKDSVKTKADLLTASAWKYSGAQYDLDNNGTGDGSLPAGVIQTCDLDNIVTFKADKTGVLDEGATKCDPSTPQTRTFSWALSNNDTQLDVTGVIFTGIQSSFKVVELTDSKLVVSQQVSTSTLSLPLPIPLPAINVIVTFIH